MFAHKTAATAEILISVHLKVFWWFTYGINSEFIVGPERLKWNWKWQWPKTYQSPKNHVNTVVHLITLIHRPNHSKAWYKPTLSWLRVEICLMSTICQSASSMQHTDQSQPWHIHRSRWMLITLLGFRGQIKRVTS